MICKNVTSLGAIRNIIFSKYFRVWKISENQYAFRALSHFSNFGIVFSKSIFYRVHPCDVFPNINPRIHRHCWRERRGAVLRTCLPEIPGASGNVGRWPIRETRLIGIPCAAWSRRFYVSVQETSRRRRHSSPVLLLISEKSPGWLRLHDFTLDLSVSSRKITAQPDITRWRFLLRAISFIPNAWVNWRCSRLNIS